MKTISNDLRLFVMDVTLHLQKIAHYDMTRIEPMFQRAYKLYVKYNVENEQQPCPICELIMRPDHNFNFCMRCGRDLRNDEQESHDWDLEYEHFDNGGPR